MKKTIILLGYIIWTTLMACSKDDGPSGPVPKPEPMANQAPGAFDLIDVVNGTTKVDVFPTFSWKPSADPDGDAITYDLLLDELTDPTTILASNMTNTSFKATDRLHLSTPYYWKVVAKDGKGKSATTSTNTFTTRTLNYPTAPVKAEAFPKGVSEHASAVFQNKLWVIGGNTGSEFLNTVWYSEDGSTWSLHPFSQFEKPFSPRVGHTTSVYNEKLWIIGGYDESYKNDLWFSENGTNWTRAESAVTFPPRWQHSTVVFDDKLWVIGGDNGINYKNDVWQTADGGTWEEATPAAAFTPRSLHTTAVFDNKLWVIGGDDGINYKNDVWYSSDGISWNLATGVAEFTARAGHTTVVYDNKLWVIGGNTFLGNVNDVWYSKDGTVWARSTEAAPFSARHFHATLVFNNKLWVIGGYTSRNSVGDVWALD